jgi:anti-sigma factor RsiW
MLDCKQIDDMLSGYLDGELTQGDRQQVEVHLETCAGCRSVYDQLASLRQTVGQMSFEQMSQERWGAMMNDVTVRTSRGAGWLLYVAGLIVVCGYAAYAFMIDDAVPALIKSGAGALVVGLLLLFVSVLRERLMARRTDKYEDVEI